MSATRLSLLRLPVLLLLSMIWASANAAPSRLLPGISQVLSAPVPGWLLVTAGATDTILALNPQTLATERSFPVGAGFGSDSRVQRIALSADGTTLYAVVFGRPTGLAIVDLGSGHTRYLELVENGSTVDPRDIIEIAPGRALVLTGDSRPIAEVDLGTGEVLRRLTGTNRGYRMLLDRARQRLFVASFGSLARFDLSGAEPPLQKQVSSSFEGFSLSPDGTLLSGGQRLWSTDTLGIVDQPRFNGKSSGSQGAFGDTDGRLYLPRIDTGDRLVLGVMSATSLAPLGQVGADCALELTSNLPAVDSPDGTRLVAWDRQSICLMDKTLTPLPKPRRAPGGRIADVLVDHGRLFATVPERNEIVILRRDSMTVMARLPVPGSPTRLVPTADRQRVFVTLALGSGIAVLDLKTLGVERQEYAMPDGATGFREAALMADGRLLAFATPTAGLAVIEDAPNHGLRWLQLPVDVNPSGVVFDAARAYAYLYQPATNAEVGRLALADLDHLVFTKFSTLNNGKQIFIDGWSNGLALSADGERMASWDGLIFNPLTLDLVRDLQRPTPIAFGQDHDTFFITRYDFERQTLMLDRHALPSGKRVSSSPLPCPAEEGLRYQPVWDEVIAMHVQQICSRRAASLLDTPQPRPPEPIPSPALLQPLTLGVRLEFSQGGRPRVVTPRRAPASVVARNGVQIEQGPGQAEYYTSSANAYRMHGGREVSADETITFRWSPPLDLLDADDTARSQFAQRGQAFLRNRQGRSASAEYRFRRRLRGYEQVSVAAGAFRALRVDYELRVFGPRPGARSSKAWSVWYAPGLGQVKELHRGEAAYELVALPAIDADRDGIRFKRDNCPTVRSKALADLDRDGAGDVCDLDDDADGVEDRLDNCPRAANADQSDVDVDAIGDACQGPA